MNYSVALHADTVAPEFKRIIGDYYDYSFSYNPIYEPKFDELPDHPITHGVHPFQIKDEWYINMRFAEGFSADPWSAPGADGTQFWPILVAKPRDAVRNGPYVAPRGPYRHIVGASGRRGSVRW